LALNLDAVESVSEFKLELSDYIESILSVLPLVTEHIDLNSFNISGSDIEQIVTVGRHLTQEISFAKSELTISYSIDFGKHEYKVEHLNLDECVISSLHGEQMGIKHLVTAIADSRLAESLTKIDRWKCNIPAETFKTLLEERGIKNIWVEED